jgi:hypothetical protein
MGEYMATIGLLISNPRIYYRITTLLKSHSIGFTSLTPDEPHPSDLLLLITTKTEDSTISEYVERLYISADTPNNYILARITAFLQGVKGKFEEVVIGVDPGFSTFGIAIFGDGVLIETITTFNVEETYQKLVQVTKLYETNKKIIKIGSSASFCRTQLLSILLPYCLDNQILIEEVNEERTSISSLPTEINSKEKSKDVIAAIHIAMREGEPLQEYESEIKEGEIRLLQEKSRQLTNGRITISRYLALQVAEGKLSLDDALRLHQDENCAT